MKKVLTLLSALLISTNCFATIQCVGVPHYVYAGFHGPAPSEQSFGVVLSTASGKFNLGQVSGELAKARYAMMLAAQKAKTEVVLEFYHLNSPDTCTTAITNRLIPTSMYSK